MKKANFDTRLTITFTKGIDAGEKITASCSVLNSLCCALGDAYIFAKERGTNYIAEDYRIMHEDIVNVLKSHGFYED